MLLHFRSIRPGQIEKELQINSRYYGGHRDLVRQREDSDEIHPLDKLVWKSIVIQRRLKRAGAGSLTFPPLFLATARSRGEDAPIFHETL